MPAMRNSVGALGCRPSAGPPPDLQSLEKRATAAISTHLVLALIQAHAAAGVVNERLKSPSVERSTPRQQLEHGYAKRPEVDRLRHSSRGTRRRRWRQEYLEGARGIVDDVVSVVRYVGKYQRQNSANPGLV